MCKDYIVFQNYFGEYTKNFEESGQSVPSNLLSNADGLILNLITAFMTHLDRVNIGKVHVSAKFLGFCVFSYTYIFVNCCWGLNKNALSTIFLRYISCIDSSHILLQESPWIFLTLFEFPL